MIDFDLILIAQETLPWQLIFVIIFELTLIWHTGVPKRIQISQFRFTDIKWQYTGYILCKFAEGRSSNPGDYEVNTRTF